MSGVNRIFERKGKKYIMSNNTYNRVKSMCNRKIDKNKIDEFINNCYLITEL